MSNDLIVKANDVIKASYQLTANEQRLILSAIAQIPKGVPVSDRNIYPIHAENFIELGVHPKTAYRDMKEAVERLYERNVIIKQGETVIKTRWVQMIIKMDRDWIRDNYQVFNPNAEKGDEELIEEAFSADYCIIGIKFAEAVLPFLSNLSSNFTQYLKQDIAGLSSAYAIRFYELMMQFKSTGFVKITIYELRKMLDLGDKYRATKDLRRWVIETAINEINEKTPINANYKLQKTGRKFTHLEISFKQKDNEKTKNENRDPNTIDWVEGATDNELKITRPLTKKQADGFAGLIAKYCAKDGNRTPEEISLGATLPQAFSNWFEAIEHIKSELQKEEAYKKYIPILSKIGYKETKK